MLVIRAEHCRCAWLLSTGEQVAYCGARSCEWEQLSFNWDEIR